MYRNLELKNTELFLGRAKCLRSKKPKRTRLLEFTASCIKVYALSNESMRGPTAAREFIKVRQQFRLV